MKFNFKFLKQRYSLFLLLLIFLLFSFFRFYNLDQRVIFDWDQERDALAIKQILLEKKLTLIGPQVLGPEGFFLGPYFTYLLTPFYFLTKLHPKAIISFIIVYNLGFFTLTFWFLKKLFTRSTALIFLLIWSLHPILIGIDVIAWNPLFVPLLVISVWALLFLMVKKPSFYSYLLIGFLLGLGINFHFQLIYLLPFSLVFLFSQKKKIVKKTIIFFGGFFFPFLPLFLFDLRHNFLNFHLLANFFTGGAKIGDYSAWLPVWKNVTVSLTGFNFPFSSLLFYLLPLVLMVFLWRREPKGFLHHFYLGGLVLWLIFPLGFTFFGQRPSEYYFNFLYPFLILLLTLFLLKIIKNWQLVFLLILLFAFLEIDQLELATKSNFLGLYFKEKVVQKIAKISRGKNFNVSFSVPLGMDAGYRYLLDWYQLEQSQNPDDPLFQIVILPRQENKKTEIIDLQIPYSFQSKNDDVE